MDDLPLSEPMVTRLRSGDDVVGPFDATYIGRDGDVLEYDLSGFSLRLHASSHDEIDNDVLLLLPGQRSAHRLVRASSPHNTFLVTERCDQLCVMCSQPPKAHHTDLFPYFAQAASLAPKDVYLGISGGEPTLYKRELFDLLLNSLEERPDLRFHVLTNGQHFDEEDIEVLRRLPHDRVLWGVPLYSTKAAQHDEIVAKPGAHARLMKSFSILARAGTAIELRTVVMKTNVDDLPNLARFVATRLPFISVWALMQLESIGYARKNWDALFFDNSSDFGSIGRSLDMVHAHGIEAQLYNFPLCTLPVEYRQFAPQTISDWKRKYVADCTLCSARNACAGFFEWYPEDRGFAGVGPL